MATIDRPLDPLLPAEPEKDNWVKELIAQRYQPKTERLKRSPIGFEFKREPFDPSSYYRALGIYKDISKTATGVEAQKAEFRRQREFEASQSASHGALGGVSANFTYNGKSRKYKLGGVSPNTAAAADYFGSKYGISNIGGRGPGSVPGSDHPRGRATDFMTKSKAQGTALANDVIANYKKWNVKYVIWWHYIWQPGRGWKKYSGPSPHTDHVHVSYNK